MGKEDAGISRLCKHEDLADGSGRGICDGGEGSDWTYRVGIQTFAVTVITIYQATGFGVLVAIEDEFTVGISSTREEIQVCKCRKTIV